MDDFVRRHGVLRAAAGALIVAALAGAAAAQSVFYRLGPAQPPPHDGAKWEYLVVAASKPQFELSMREVTMQPLAESLPELPFVYEARVLEGRLNYLGEAGWELVAIVGNVGGDQMYVFKRPRR